MFDRFDICEAYALYADHYNVGGYATGRTREEPIARNNGDIWSRLSRMGFQRRPHFRDTGDLTENGRAVYLALVARKGF